MQPTLAIFQRIGILMSQDVGTLAPAANPPKLHLAKNAFTPGQFNVPGDFVEADFDGYAAIAAIVGNQLTGSDALTDEILVEMKIPAGGWRWQTTGLTNLPEQIFGAYLMNDAGTQIYGSALFESPIPLNSVGDIVEVNAVTFRLRFNGIY